MARNSAMRKAAAPMTGGISCPPVDATASMAPARWARYPPLTIRGIVMTPVVTTLETVLPEIEPNREDAETEILAGPPRKRPMRTVANSVKKAEPPDLKRICPKRTKATTMLVTIRMGVPKTAELSHAR